MGLFDRHAFPRVYGGASRFLSGYYVANTLVILSYLLARRHFLEHPQPEFSRLFSTKELWDWERQAWGLFVVAMVIRYPRTASIDGFLSSVFLFAKAVVGVLAYITDVRIFWCYIVLFVTMFLMFPQPVYEGPDKIEYLTPATLKELVLEGSAEGTAWLVEFFAHWSPTCVHLEPVMADLSLKYATEGLRFGKFDLSRWPKLAKDFQINMAGASPQLPTLIMFENGEEVGRIPHIFPDGSVAKGRYSRRDIVRGFELDSRYTRSKAEETKKQAEAKQGEKKDDACQKK